MLGLLICTFRLTFVNLIEATGLATMLHLGEHLNGRHRNVFGAFSFCGSEIIPIAIYLCNAASVSDYCYKLAEKRYESIC